MINLEIRSDLMKKKAFIERMTVAIREAFKRGVRFNPAVAVAQAALETGWGSSELAQKANNLFSIKAGTSWTGEVIELPGMEWHQSGGWRRERSLWRKYDNWTDCLQDYGQIIASLPWYQDAFKNYYDTEKFLAGLLMNGSEPGWASDPDYFAKVKAVGLEVQKLGGPPWEE
jgi:flagellum-specific peptidoglycan hydrolase FlgJ